MRIYFLGVRGSTPAPGPDFVRYGGHSSCVAVGTGPDRQPSLVLDAGTGLRTLTGLLGSDPYDGSILLSHLHWDHVQGIPFFSAGDRDDARVTVYLPEQGNHTGRDLMAQSMSPPAFPIGPEGLRGLWSFAAIPAGRFSVGDFEITAADVAHKGGRTFGYRVECCGTSLGYVPDHAPAAGVDVDALALLQGVDLLIHDAQFVEDERARAEDYGHGTVDDAVALAHRVGARSLALFHHAPHRTDDAVDAILAGVRTTIPAFMAREGLIVDLP